MPIAEFSKLAPFARRAGIAVTGRERLARLGKRLVFVWVTTDASERTVRELQRQFACPLVCCLTSADVERLLGYQGTKVVGFVRSSLAQSLYRAGADFRIREDSEP